MSWTTIVRLLGSLGHTVLVAVLGFAALFIAYLVADPNSGAPLEGAIWAVLYAVLIYGLVYVFQVRVAKKPLAPTGLFHWPVRSAVVGIGLAILVFGAILAANLATGSLRYTGSITASEGGTDPVILLLTGCVVCLGIAIGEELLFRGYLFEYLKGQHGVAGAAIISSVVFSLTHVMDGDRSALELFNIIVIGLAFVLLRLQTGSLWVPIGFHWAWNWFDMYLVTMGDEGVLQFTSTRSGAGPESDVFTTIAFIALAALLSAGIAKRKRLKLQRLAGERLWPKGAGVAVAVWLIIAAVTLGAPALLRGEWYQVVATDSGKPQDLEVLPAADVILPSAELAATHVRAPLAWQRATGNGVVVLELAASGDGLAVSGDRLAASGDELVTSGDGLIDSGSSDLSATPGWDVLASIAPAAVYRRQVVDGRTPVQVPEDVDIVALPDAGLWQESALVDQVRRLVETGKSVFAGVDGDRTLPSTTRRRLTQSGATTVGSSDVAGIVVDPLVLQSPADVYAPVGTNSRQAAAVVAAGVAALSMEAFATEAYAGDVRVRSLRERLIDGAITRWQVVDVRTGEIDEQLYKIDADGSYLAVQSRARRSVAYRSLDAARSAGVELPVSWDVNALHVAPAWHLATGKGVRVAVVAEGFAHQRPSLQDRVVAQSGFCPEPWDSYRSPQGTSTAEAVVRIAPDAELIITLVEEGDHTGRFPSAVIWAVQNEADVIVIPFGPEMNSATANQAIDFAVSSGTVVIWQAYEGENRAVIRPLVPGVGFAVGPALEFSAAPGAESGIGPKVWSGAEPKIGQMPGVPRVSGLPYLDWEFPRTGLDCTPEVAGQIAGLAALVIEVAPHLDGNRVLDLLTATGNQVGDLVIPDALQLVLAAAGVGD